LSTIVTDPTIDPPLVGFTVTEKPHFALVASTKPGLHGFALDPTTEYSPEAVMLDRVIEAPLAFNTCAVPVLVAPIATLPKFSAVGEKVKGFDDGPPVALPERFTDCGL
jgi:hypothetical protein